MQISVTMTTNGRGKWHLTPEGRDRPLCGRRTITTLIEFADPTDLIGLPWVCLACSKKLA